jgi:hypothetical protein
VRPLHSSPGDCAEGLTFRRRTSVETSDQPLWITAVISSVAFLPVLLSRVPQRESEGGVRELDREAAPLALVVEYSSV